MIPIFVNCSFKMADQSSERPREKTTLLSFARKILNRKTLGVLALGQFLSLLLCGTGVFSQLLEKNYAIQAPTTQSFVNYLLLALVYTTQFACQREQFKETLKTRGWKYLILGLVDVEANFLVVKAYQYTNLTSIQVLDCLAIASVLILSWAFLRVHYKAVHYAGVAISLVGIACLITADYFGSRSYGPGPNQAVGDVLVICGAIMYGISNVAQEFVVKTYSRVEFLGMMGLFGTIVSVIQMLALERHQLPSIVNGPHEVVLYLVGFGVCLFLLYSVMPVAMEMSSATVVNLSILTADFYSLLCGVFLFKYKFSVLYFVAFTLVIVGVVVYNTKPTPSRSVADTAGHPYNSLSDDVDQTRDQAPGCCSELDQLSNSSR